MKRHKRNSGLVQDVNGSFVFKEYEYSKDELRIKKIMESYGSTIGEYFEMYDKQKNCCSICGKDMKHQRLSIDHDHDTGFFRGLICGRCNWGLGHFYDNINSLENAIKYLKDFKVKLHRKRRDLILTE